MTSGIEPQVVNLRDDGAVGPLRTVQRKLKSAEVRRGKSILPRCVGCRKAALYSPKTHLPLLGEKEVRLCVDRLWLGGFFARFTYRRRLTFYSHRLTADALRQQVVALCVQSQEKIAAARKADAAFSFSVGANSGEPEANQGRT